MTIRFKCPHCQKPLSVKDHLAGKRAPCPACKEVLRIPAPAPAAAPVDVEALAASALGEEAAPPPAEDTAEDKPITFTCNWCGEDVQVAASEAGKQTPCPNPDCKRIVKVPLPKKEKPKDWRTIEKHGPSAAKINQVEKLDDNTWGTQTNKGKVSTKALVEAGVVVLPPKPGIGVSGWIQRTMWGTVIACALVGLLMIGRRLKSEKDMKDLTKVIFTPAEIQAAKFTSPVLGAELYRGLGLMQARAGNLKDALEKLRTARGLIPRDVTDKTLTINVDLFLLDLALAQVELGGNEDEALGKEKLFWKDEVLRKELEQTLERIKAPEARVWAMREVTSRLLEKGRVQDKGQTLLAIGLASKTNDIVVGGRKPMESQIIALAVATEQKKLLEGDQYPKAPEAGKEIKDSVARAGYAEGYARKGKEHYKEALDLAQAPGLARDQLEACVGVAAVILAMGKDKAALDEAKPFLEEGLKAAKAAAQAAAQKKGAPPSPWLVLHLVRLGARVDGLKEEIEKLPATLPADFRRRAELELFLARCENAKEAVTPPAGDELSKDETTIGLTLEAVARQNAWFGQSEDVLLCVAEGEHARYRPLVNLGLALGHHIRRP